MNPFVLLDAAIVLALAGAVALAGGAHQARRRAVLGMLGVTSWTAATGLAMALAGQGDSPFWQAAVPLTVALVGWVAVALCPSAGSRPSTHARILLLVSISLAFVSVSHPLVLAALWATAAAVAWWEVHDQEGEARVFAAYQLPSTVLVGVGAMFLYLGESAAGSILIAAGMAIRQAIMPLHSWFVRFVERAPMGVVVAFACPQLAVYGHIRLVADALPVDVGYLLAALGAATAVLAAALGAVQVEARRALAFLMLSQSGLVAFGLPSHSALTHAGVLLLWLVLALATSGFAMTMAALEARRGRLTLDAPAGSFASTPRMAIAFLILGFASVGLPTTLGFVAEDLILQGSVDEWPVLGIALILATGLNGFTVMQSFFHLFHGARDGGAPDLTQREWMVLTVLLVALLFTGALPGAVVGSLSDAPSLSESAPGVGDDKLANPVTRRYGYRMRTTVDAIYEKGTLVLPQPLSSPEKARARVTIELNDPARDGWLRLSEEALTTIWDNPADDVFNALLSK